MKFAADKAGLYYGGEDTWRVVYTLTGDGVATWTATVTGYERLENSKGRWRGSGSGFATVSVESDGMSWRVIADAEPGMGRMRITRDVSVVVQKLEKLTGMPVEVGTGDEDDHEELPPSANAVWEASEDATLHSGSHTEKLPFGFLVTTTTWNLRKERKAKPCAPTPEQVAALKKALDELLMDGDMFGVKKETEEAGQEARCPGGRPWVGDKEETEEDLKAAIRERQLTRPACASCLTQILDVHYENERLICERVKESMRDQEALYDRWRRLRNQLDNDSSNALCDVRDIDRSRQDAEKRIKKPLKPEPDCKTACGPQSPH